MHGIYSRFTCNGVNIININFTTINFILPADGSQT